MRKLLDSTCRAAAYHPEPTLSRQIRELENELGAELLIRGRRQLTLTESGVLFQQRAREIVSLLEKTARDLDDQRNLAGGVVSIGCVESAASKLLSELIAAFSNQHPMVQYELYSADGDDIREKLDRGGIDIGFLLEPVEAAKYDYIRLPVFERWGILTRSDDPVAGMNSISVEQCFSLPLIAPRRRIVQEEIASWLGVDSAKLHVVATQNLLTNASLLVDCGLGYAICVEGAYTIRPNDAFAFIPFSPERKTGHVMAWKKNHPFSAATERFIAAAGNTYQV